MKYYNRFVLSGEEKDFLPQKRGPKWKSRRPYPYVENKVIALRELGNNKFDYLVDGNWTIQVAGDNLYLPFSTSITINGDKEVLKKYDIILQYAPTIYGTLEATVNFENGEPSYGASIHILGTANGGIVKQEGKAIVPKLKAGTYQIKISIPEYKQKFESIDIVAESVLKVNYQFLDKD